MSHQSSFSQHGKKELQVPHSDRGQIGRGSKIFSRDAQAKFLKKLASGEHTVQSAAEAAGFKRSTIYLQRERSERFAREFERAYKLSMGAVEDRLHGLAIGRQFTGNITAIFGLLRANMPEKYRENMKVSLGAEGDFATLLSGMALALSVRKEEAEKNANALEHKE